MATYLDTSSWNRQQQFEFFKDYEIPFFNITAMVNVRPLLTRCRETKHSFFTACLFAAIKAANEVVEFRYRLRGDHVLIHDVIHVGSTVLNENDTFSFVYFDYDPDFAVFEKNARIALELNRQKKGLLEPRNDQDDLIHFSVVPWIHFTSVTHAMKFRTGDSIPKMVFGKYQPEGSQSLMPVSVQVHHSLMDALHVARFFDEMIKNIGVLSDQI